MRARASGMPTRSSISMLRRRASLLEQRRATRSTSVNCRATRKYGIQRRHRILEDHRDALAAHAAHLALGQTQ